ncbi:transposase [Bacillus coahuilensis]|uniref:transposase n=1 Tax=Bacillus coahuilensis TaxID=408580 RepID=UPI0009E778DF
MRYVFHRNSEKLTEEDRWYLNRYLGLSNELKVAYELKEAFSQWFNEAKENGQGSILQTTKFITRVLSKSRTSQFTRV